MSVPKYQWNCHIAPLGRLIGEWYPRSGRPVGMSRSPVHDRFRVDSGRPNTHRRGAKSFAKHGRLPRLQGRISYLSIRIHKSKLRAPRNHKSTLCGKEVHGWSWVYFWEIITPLPLDSLDILHLQAELCHPFVPELTENIILRYCWGSRGSCCSWDKSSWNVLDIWKWGIIFR